MVCLAIATGLAAGEPSAAKLFKEGQKAEREGDIVRAYLLYTEAAVKDPKRKEYWARSQALRTRAALKARVMPKITPEGKTVLEPLKPLPGLSGTITEDDLAELRRLKPPPDLQPTPGRKNIDLRGNARALFEQTAKIFGLEVVFDGDYQPGAAFRFRLEDADFREAIQALEAATASFVVPLGERLFMVVKDTPQKRAEVEPVIAITIPIPDPVTPEEAQELARAVQQTMDLTKLSIDTTRRMVLIKDRISKVRPAQALFQQLARGRTQVAIQLQFLEVDRSSLLTYGLLLPRNLPILYVGSSGVVGALTALANLKLSTNMFGVGIGDAQAFASMAKATGRNLLDAEVRTAHGSTATFHIGDQFPIATATFIGGDFLVPPTFTFEDLGLVMKVTPHVNGMEEISLDVNAEFKVLAGQSINGVPVISTRRLESKVRLRAGEWAIVAGLMSSSEAKAFTGLPGVSQLPLIGPLLRKNDDEKLSTEVLLLLRPYVLSLPPSELPTRAYSVGSEGRLRIPL
ncbi:MAG TPA: type II and III secretion system protein [Bryobacteraceae bacterium]|nr:type II and III secretion system protein [Bryobacteraceae bacterium]HOQ43855.1 type II and III secretion system protein [Bryobacteraceae bacterium]HPU71702.1 type II and III secretion system protein [Bryobacteraceae bacterium]